MIVPVSLVFPAVLAGRKRSSAVANMFIGLGLLAAAVLALRRLC